MKDDEVRFLVKLARERPKQAADGPFADAVGASLGIHPKRVDYLLQKWTDKGWWNYGVSARSGWLEPAGIEAAEKLRP